MPLETSAKLVYIGPKPVKKDNVTNSSYVWAGYGDVQELPIDIARKLLAFPTVWVTEQKFEEMKAIAEAAKQEAEQGEEEIEDDSTESKPEKPADESATSDRGQLIKAAILSLEQGNPEHFAPRTGAPLTEAVKARMGDESVGFKEVAAVWAGIKAEAVK